MYMYLSLQFQSENDALIRQGRSTGHHYTEEILAQAMCQAHANQRGHNGRVYAVGRYCPPWPSNGDTCAAICTSRSLRYQDFHTFADTWSCIGAYHVHYYRPATKWDGQPNTATLGLKSRREGCTYRKCGPNFCCCHARRN